MLYLSFGNRGFHGRIDQVREPVTVNGRRAAVFVATEFLMVSGVPLVPRRSYAVAADPGFAEEVALWIGLAEPLAVVPVRFSARSVLVAYLRAVLILSCPLAVLAGAILLALGLKVYGALTLTWPAGCPFLVRLSYRLTRARPERAAELRQMFVAGGDPLNR